MPPEYTNFNVKIDSKTYDELKKKVKSNGMNMTSFLRLAIRNYDLLASLQESNEEKNNDFFADMNKRMNKLEKRVEKMDEEALSEVAEHYRRGTLSGNQSVNNLTLARSFNVEED